MKVFSKPDVFILRAVVGYASLASIWIFFSDSLLGQISDIDNFVNLATYKGIFFVSVTTILLYFALHQATNLSIPPSTSERKASWLESAAIGMAFLSFGATALGVYYAETNAHRRAVISQVQAIASIKTDTVNRWLEEQKRDVTVYCNDWTHRAELSRWQIEGSVQDRRRVAEVLKLTGTAHDFAAVALVGPDGVAFVGDPAAGSDSPEFLAAVKRAADGSVTFLDLHRRSDGTVHMAFLAPIYGIDTAANRLLAVAVFDMRPQDWLFPALESWPLPSNSAEVVLTRIEGDQVVYLSKLRRANGSIEWLRRPLSDPDLLAVRHARGEDGSIAGVDYSGTRVLAVALTVPIAGWTLVAKIDEAEALGGWSRLAIAISVSLAVLVAAAAGVSYFLRQRQRVRAALSELAQRRQLQAVEDRFQLAFEQAPVGMGHASLDGRWIWFNRALTEITGFTAEQLSKMSVLDVLHPDDRAGAARSLERIVGGEATSATAERRVIRADGAIGHVNITASIIHGILDDSRYVIAFVEDISARRQAEAALRASEERFSLAMRGANDGLWDWNLVDGSIYYSPRWKTMLGYEPEEIVDRIESHYTLLHPDDVEATKACTADIFAGRLDSYTCEFRMRAKSGEWRNILSRAFVVRSPDGTPLRMVGTHVDVTERNRADEDLRQAAAVFTNTQEAVVITDPCGTILDTNPAFTMITGWSRDAAVGQPVSILQSSRHDCAIYGGLWRTMQTDGHWQGEIWHERRDGDVYPAWLTISTVRDHDGHVARCLGTFTDISKLKESEERLGYQAHHDPLTNLPNRILLIEELQKACARAVAECRSGAVLFLDLDRFKNVNDSLGHAAGDELLLLVAHRLSANLPAGALLARLGGDEFVGLLTEVAAGRSAAALAQSWIERLDQAFVLSGGQTVYISASVGISLFP
ncbi:MAG: PAS domain S-box protein, partial [Ancalomicrobiaceae bacterium]|nr:PAS domain S-box protein [Ancalomicrobiaceae bacterium]